MRILLLIAILLLGNCSNNNSISSGTEIGNAKVAGIVYNQNNSPVRYAGIQILTTENIPTLIYNIKSDSLGYFSFEIEKDIPFSLYVNTDSLATFVESLSIKSDVFMDSILLNRTGDASITISDSIYNDSGFIYLSGTLIKKSVTEAVRVDNIWVLTFTDLPTDSNATFSYEIASSSSKAISGSFAIESDKSVNVISNIFWKIYPLASEKYNALTCDVEGVLWWGASQTIYSFTNSMVNQIFISAETFPFDTISTMEGGEDGTVWFGTKTGKLGYIKSDLKHILDDQPFTDKINSIATSTNDGLWFATESKGLFRYKNAEWDSITMANSPLMNTDSIVRVIEDNSGGVWFYDKQNTLFHADSNLIHNNENVVGNIKDFCVTEDNVLWLITDSLLYTITKYDNLSIYNISEIDVTHIYQIEAVDSELWIATENKIYLLRNNKIINVNWQGSPFGGNKIFELISYGDSNIWLYSDAGLFEIYFD